MLVDYRKLDTWLHRMNPKISMLCVLFAIVASIVWTNVIYLAILTLALYLVGFIALLAVLLSVASRHASSLKGV